MTRINVGVEPSELCDQHLIAEYRELPRMWNFIPKSKPPKEFCLGTGHMLWCSQYTGLLADRYESIVNEMYNRGFVVNFPTVPEGKSSGKRPTEDEINRARQIVLQRLQEKYKTMKSRPRWTNR